jgi:hypothetical protein
MIIAMNEVESRGHFGGCFLPILLCRLVTMQEKKIRINELMEITPPPPPQWLNLPEKYSCREEGKK